MFSPAAAAGLACVDTGVCTGDATHTGNTHHWSRWVGLGGCALAGSCAPQKVSHGASMVLWKPCINMNPCNAYPCTPAVTEGHRGFLYTHVGPCCGPPQSNIGGRVRVQGPCWGIMGSGIGATAPPTAVLVVVGAWQVYLAVWVVWVSPAATLVWLCWGDAGSESGQLPSYLVAGECGHIAPALAVCLCCIKGCGACIAV